MLETISKNDKIVIIFIKNEEALFLVQTYNPSWDLDSIFPGGSESKQFQAYLEMIEKEMGKLLQSVEDWTPSETDTKEEHVEQVIKQYEKLAKQLRDAFAFISCLSAQNVHDEKANLLVGRRSSLGAKMNTIKTVFDQKLNYIGNETWENLLQKPAFKEIAFVLNEYRDKAKEQLSAEQEMLMSDLAIDGYQGWGQMYNTIVGTMTVDIEENGKTNTYSVGQAANKLSDPDRSVRKHVYKKLSETWENNAELFSQTLNHLAGFRLQMYKHRKWDDVLKEPLTINRMKEETLNIMWKSIDKFKPIFVQYLNRKAQLLGLEKLSMYDIGAPLSQTVNKRSYTDGANFIIKHFREFSPKMAAFSQMAFENRWIEAEDRAGKRPGGFCTSFPASKQTRIFMTYSGTASNIVTLAHELGHAYHQHVMNDVHGFNQRYAMNVAETASTFAEIIVADAAVKNANNEEERISLLENKIQRSITFFMNIRARFMFELQFYKQRKKGLVSVTRLNELMVEAQKEAYRDAITDYDPTFWASKLHFHITGVPFYNFPYTFGYLFSLGIYAHAKKQGKSFEDDYIALLQDTGQMTVEELAMKHLNVDLTKEEFWEQAIQLCVNDVEKFLTLT